MFGKKKTEVIVAGAGPVGLFAAAELTRLGISTWIADDASRTTGMSYALGLHGASLEILDDLGLTDAVLKAGNRVDRMSFYEGHQKKFTVDLSATGGKYPFLTILPQSALETGLETWLAKHKTKMHWQHRVGAFNSTERPLEVMLEQWGEDYVGYVAPHQEAVLQRMFPVNTEFVIGADGHRSLVRNRLQLEYPEVSKAHLFGVFEFSCDWDMGNEAVVVFDDFGMAVMWPLPDRHCRWSFELSDNGLLLAERYKSRMAALGRMVFPSLDEKKLHELLEQRAPWFPARVEEVLWSVAIRFEYRLAEAFGRNAMWLAGDSAHLGGPVGIHSMNVGLREARDLAVIMENILRQNAGQDLLETYNRERIMEWRSLMNLDDQLMVKSDASEFVKKNATAILSCLPASGKSLNPLLEQVGLELSEPVLQG